MPSADKPELDHQVLSRYLLGSLPAEEAERLDELSVADDEFALRLDAVENDLADAYARGDLSGDALAQFQKFYLSSPRRREKVEFAKTLHRYGEKAATAVPAATTAPAIPGVKSTDQTLRGRSPNRWFTIPRLDPQWGFAVVAMALLFAGGYLFVQNQHLRQQATEARNQQIALNQHTQDLELQLREQRSANSGMLRELDRLREALATPHSLKIVGALLLPQMRGASQVPTVSVPIGTDQVQLRLQLESDDFPAYRVTLKDPVLDRVILSSSTLKARSEAEAKIISIKVPAGLLKSQYYILELNGVPSRGTPDFLSSYAFKVVLK